VIGGPLNRRLFLIGLALVFGSSRLGGADKGAAEIAFLRLTSGFWQVWVMSEDGSNPKPVTRSTLDKVHVAWRPGSHELLYNTNRGETFLVDLESGAEKRILDQVATIDAGWSPDGRKLTFSRAPENLAQGKTSLWTADVDGRNQRKLAGGDDGDALAAIWLRDGKSVLYRRCSMLSNMEVDHEFWIMDTTGADRGQKVEGDDERLKFDQALSSTGVLAYSSPRSGSYEVWTMPVGGQPSRLTNFKSYAGNPNWSPDGRSLAFDADDNGTVQVFRTGADGKGQRRLTSDAAPSRKPVWRLGAAQYPTVPAAAPARAQAAAKGASVPAASTPAAGASGLSISWVSTDKAAFVPEKGETVDLRFRVSQPSTVSVRFLDPQDRVVRSIKREVTAPGDQTVAWDGKDERGGLVPADAYTYVIGARTPSAEEVSFDLRGRTGGEPVWPLDTTLAEGKPFSIQYTLPQASRVRLITSRKDTTWPIRTLLDWTPREAGRQSETWDGWDAAHVIDAARTPQLIPIVYAFSLPKNTVIVQATDGAPRPQAAIGTEVVPGPPAPPDRNLHLHSRHNRGRCYDPKIQLSLAEASAGADGVYALSKPTALRLAVADDQGPGHVRPIPRVSVFIYVDGVMVERYLVGYTPFQFQIQPERLGPGEHVVTGLMAWRDDHFGIAHIKVRVGS
jgi:hypothetical protein